MPRCDMCSCELDFENDECPFCWYTRIVYCCICSARGDARNGLEGWRCVTRDDNSNKLMCPECQKHPDDAARPGEEP